MNTEIKILIVDDFTTVRKLIKNQLKECSYRNTVEAEDGQLELRLGSRSFTPDNPL